jgi:hypothetical protein
MRKTVLGKSGLEVSAVGFGGIPIQRLSDDQAVEVIRRSLDLGVTFIDTAAGYGDSQRKIGAAIAGRRDGLVLASKSPQRTRQGMLDDIERSRREMDVDVIDLYQYHNCFSADQWEEISAAGGAIDGLLEARQKGWIAHVGVTSHSLEYAMTLIEQDVFETLQFPFNLVTREPADALIPRCRERNVGFIVMKPLCGGQYDNAELAFRYLNGYPDVVAIPGIETCGEIEQIADVVASERTLEGDSLRQAEQIAQRLGKQFCRRCGYCLPCPEGISVNMVMIYESLEKRLPPEKIASHARSVIEAAENCQSCGLCEQRCPYDLPITDILHRSAERARNLLEA